MTILFTTLGVVLAVLAIGYIIYSLFFKNKNDDENRSGDTGGTGGGSGSKGEITILPSLLSFKLESTGQMYEVKRIPNGGVTVGRASPSDIIVTSNKGNFLSAEHFVICSDEKGMYINVIDHAHESGNGIRLKPEMNSPKIKSSIDITHKLKIYIGNDAITFYLPNENDMDDITPVIDNKVTRRK